MSMIKTMLLRDLAEDIRECTKCPVSSTRMKAVPGSGSGGARAMFIAEKPGTQEDRTGYPMVGPVGLTFDSLLASVGLARSEFFVTNVVKCKPVSTSPTLQCLDNCKPWLLRQIEIIQPKLLVLAGNFAISLFYPGEKIGDVHGKPRRMWDFVVIPTYHPAVLAHNERLRSTILQDFQVVQSIMRA